MEYKVKVHWGDMNAAGIVFYPNFYKWMDEATHEYFSAIGHPTDVLFKENVALPLIETHCDVKRPFLYNLELIVQTEVVLLKKKVFKLSHQFYFERQLVAEGYEVRAWASTAEGRAKAVSIPEQVKNKLHFKEQII